jgi:Tol biopolymer transport system component/tRNA A-37 threonylcarbamoyl transferase component Bud32
VGVVYKAVDTLLERNVAIKVLSPDKVADLSSRRRFIHEAKTASSLNHPNIVTIHEIGTVGEASFIAMEYVAGRRLDELIGANGMPIPQVLDYAVQIADAISAAHAVRIVHRDLKPGNIMVTSRGLVKVLDFGLAKLAERSPVGDETVTTSGRDPLTVEGAIVGTVAYLSPEQAAGGKVDARSDIFAFGSVLYEMVTSRRAFTGDNLVSTLMAIAGKEPIPIGEIRRDTPAQIEEIIARCLQKEPARRFQSMDDLKAALDDLRQQSIRRRIAIVKGIPPARVLPKLWVAGTGLALACLLGGAVWWRTRPVQERPWHPVLTRLTADKGMSSYPALSADGKLLAYASDRGGGGNLDIWVRQIVGGDPIQITNDPANEYDPAFSPDGTMIAYRSDRDAGGIYAAPALGGPSRLIANLGRRPLFSPDGKQILYWVGSGIGRLFLVDAEGGQPRAFQPAFDSARHPVWSPDGKHILFLGTGDEKAVDGTGKTGESLDWWIAPAAGGTAYKTGALETFRRAGMASPPGEKQIHPDTWTADGGVVFSAILGGTTNIWQIAMSPKSRQVTGAPQRLTLGTNLEVQARLASIPEGSRMVFASLTRSVDLWTLPVDANRAKVTGELRRLTEDVGLALSPTISPDGKKVVFVSTRSGKEEIWLKDLTTDKETPMTLTPGDKASPYRSGPSISPDGSEVAYETTIGHKISGVFTVSIGRDGRPSPPRKLCEQCGSKLTWSSDSRQMLFGAFPPARAALLDLASGKSVELLRHRKNNVWQATFSPDDRWVSFIVVTGPLRARIYVARMPENPEPIPESRWIPITDGEDWDDKPRWSPDGKVLFFVSQRDGFGCIWYQRLDLASKVPLGVPAPLYHVHGGRLSMASLDSSVFALGVAYDKMVFNLGELTGDIWMAQTHSHPQ